MVTKEQIDRINELAKKARSSDGLTPEEMTERAKLREEYLNAIRQNFKQTLDNIDIIDKMRQVKKSKKYIDIFFGSKILII